MLRCLKGNVQKVLRKVRRGESDFWLEKTVSVISCEGCEGFRRVALGKGSGKGDLWRHETLRLGEGTEKPVNEDLTLKQKRRKLRRSH